HRARARRLHCLHARPRRWRDEALFGAGRHRPPRGKRRRAPAHLGHPGGRTRRPFARVATGARRPAGGGVMSAAVAAMKPWRLVHEGHVEAAGLLFDAALLTEARARARALSAWVPGSRVFRAGEGTLYLLVWPAPRRINALTAPGAPVVP